MLGANGSESLTRQINKRLRTRQLLQMSNEYRRSRTASPASSIRSGGSLRPPDSPLKIADSSNGLTPVHSWSSWDAAAAIERGSGLGTSTAGHMEPQPQPDTSVMLEGVYIFDLTGRILLGFPIKNGPDVTTLLTYVTDPDYSMREASLIEVSPSQLVYRQPYRRLVFIIPCGPLTPPLLVQQYVTTLIRTLEVYLEEPLSQTLIESNSASLAMLLNHTVDAGLPDVTEPDILRVLVPRNTIIDKLLGGIGPSNAPAAWEHPWRRAGVKHGAEELFVDIVEHLTLLVSGKGKKGLRGKGPTGLGSSSGFYMASPAAGNKRPTVCRVRGEIHVRSKLSGLPEVHLDFALPAAAARKAFTPAFHASVDLSQWNSQRLIAFVPPDEPAVIADYVLDIADQGIVFAELRRGLGDDSNEFEVHVSTSIDNQIKFVDNLTVTVASPPAAKSIKELRNTSGNFDSSAPTAAVWTFAEKVPVGWNATFRGQITGEAGPLQPLYIKVGYELLGRVPSQASVNSLSIVNWRGSGSKPFKGVRYQTKTDSVVVR